MQTTGAMRNLILAACALAAGCSGSGASSRDGSGAGGSGTGAAGTTGAGGTTGGGGNGSSYEPMSVGATWTYNTTEVADGGVGTVSGTKVVTVEANEAVPMRAGITAWRIYTHVPGSEEQLTWQAETTTGIVRYRDEVFVSGAPRMCTSISATGCTQSSAYTPSKLRIDTTSPHLATGATYTESFTQTDTDATGVSSSSKPFGWKVINAAESVTVPAGTFTAVHLQKSNGNSGAIDKDYWFVLNVGKVKETSNAGHVEQLASFNIP